MQYLEDNRRPLTAENQEMVRFWVDTLLCESNSQRAAHDLFTIRVRTRAAACGSPPARFPPGTAVLLSQGNG